jgi:polysaccharide transporter, PST family
MHFNKKLFFWVGGGAIVLSFCIYYVAPLIIEYIFGNVYMPSIVILQVFSLLPVIIVTTNIFGIQTMLPLGMDRVYSRISMIAVISNFIVFIPASYWFGSIGAAWANVIVSIFVLSIIVLQLQIIDRCPLSYNIK